MKVFSIFVFLFYLLIIGCITDQSGDGRDNPYSLVNKTNDTLYYEVYCDYFNNIYYHDKLLLFDTVLLPYDTLLLYISDMSVPPNPYPDKEYVPFWGSKTMTIISENNNVLFYKTEDEYCGKEDFVGIKIDNHKYWYKYYWTIDSTYIADKSCDITLEELNDIGRTLDNKSRL